MADRARHRYDLAAGVDNRLDVFLVVDKTDYRPKRVRFARDDWSGFRAIAVEMVDVY